MKIYGSKIAPTSQMLLIAVAEKGQSVQFIEIDFSKGEQKSAAHLERHPYGVTPTLEDDHGNLFEARAILRYLDRVLPGPALTPSTPREYGLMEQFIGVEQAYFSPNVMMHFYAKFLRRPYTDEELAQGREGAAKVLEIIEKNLADKPYLAGPHFSLADIAWMPYLQITRAVGLADLLLSRPHVNDWSTRLLARPSLQF